MNWNLKLKQREVHKGGFYIATYLSYLIDGIKLSFLRNEHKGVNNLFFCK